MKTALEQPIVPNTKPLRYVLRDSYEAKRLLLQRSSDWSLDWTNEHTQACYAYATEFRHQSTGRQRAHETF